MESSRPRMILGMKRDTAVSESRKFSKSVYD